MLTSKDIFTKFLTGIEKWPGKQTHSHNYRTPEPFNQQVVVVIGNGPSAYDISRDISTVAKEVHLSSRSPDVIISKLGHYQNIWQHSKIYMAKEDGTIEFEDGSSVLANIILHCTGYKCEFPFLKTNGIVSVDDNRVGPLYKQVFPPQLAPRLSFVGLPKKIIIFGAMELQSKWIARVLSGRVYLPSEEEMIADVEDYYQLMTTLQKPKHLTHYPDNCQEYLDGIAEQARVSPIEEWRCKIFKELIRSVENGQEACRDELCFK